MSNTINPYGASRPELQRAVQPSELEEGTDQAGLNEKIDQSLAKEQLEVTNTEAQIASGFDSKLEGAIDRTDTGSKSTQGLEGLTAAEQQLIYRYFPESPSLELRLYKPDRSTDKVDPGSVGSRVDLRG